MLSTFCGLISGHDGKHTFGSTGGQSKVTPSISIQDHVLSVDQMPSHSHGGSTGAENVALIYYDIGVDSGASNRFSPVGGPVWFKTRAATGQSKFQHVHPVRNEGGNQGHSHRAVSSEINIEPPFYALLHIMKL